MQIRHLALGCWLSVLSAILIAQQTPPETPAFDAASVKVSTGETNQTPGTRKGPSPFTIDPARLAIRRLTLKGIISRAYAVEDAQVTGGPGWIEEDRYDVDATVAQPADREHMLHMLQALLAQRFQLRLRKETKVEQRYVLVVGKNGPNYGPHFHASGPGAPVSGATPSFSDGLKGYTMPKLVFFLTDNRDWWDPDTANGMRPDALPVIDDTGLTGTYDLVWNNKSRRDFLDSFERETGLKLESRKIPTHMIVVESVSRPTPN
jgi:uncharacterized protein (TIGR03435 family)